MGGTVFKPRKSQSLNKPKTPIDVKEIQPASPKLQTINSSELEASTQSREVLGRKDTLAVNFSWDESFSLPSNYPRAADNDHELNSATEEQPRKKLRTRMNVEDGLYQVEKRVQEGLDIPKSISDYEKFLMHSPNSSLVWIKYMAFHVQQYELDKARGIAERAIKTISFREEAEKHHIWLALINIESAYGSESSLKAAFDRAVSYSEPIKLYQHLAMICEKKGEVEKADELYNTMIRRFGQNKDVWIDFGAFLFKQGNTSEAHSIMHRSLKSLPKAQHIDVLSKYAQNEFIYGAVERGKTLFENILSSYPRRSDVWSLYVDMLVKVNDIDLARLVLERQLQSTVSKKGVNNAFKKWMEFEKRHGTLDSIIIAKEKASVTLKTN